MSAALTHTTAVRTSLADASVGASGYLGSSAKLKFYQAVAITGTISATNGSATVTGSGTSFTTALAVGQKVRFGSDTSFAMYTVSAIGSNTSLTLTGNYTGTTISGSTLRACPADANGSLTGATLGSTITGISFGAASSGVSTVSASTADSAATGCLADFYRLTKSDNTAHTQGYVAPSGAELTMADITIPAGANVSLTGTNTYTAPL